MDVLFDRAGEFAIEHRTPDRTYSLGTVRVSERPVERSYERGFGALRHSEELAAERERLEADLDRPPDKTLALVGRCLAWRNTASMGTVTTARAMVSTLAPRPVPESSGGYHADDERDVHAPQYALEADRPGDRERQP